MAKKVLNPSKKRQFLFNPLKRPLPYIGLILALVIFIFQSTIRTFTANFVGDWLVNTLSESTEGNYILDYDYVRLDIFTKELRIQNLTLELDSGINRDDYLDNYSNLVEVSTPLVVLKLESIWDLIFEEKLQIAYIGLKEPSVKLIKSESLTEEELEVNQKVTAEKLRTYLKEIQIDSFRILNGAIEIGLQNAKREGLFDFKIRNFSTLLRGFKLDETDPDKLFRGIYVRDLELEVLDQEVTLPLLHHQIKFERLWISSSDSIIQIDTLAIRPLSTADPALTTKLDLKGISLTGIDFRKAYDEGKIDVSKLLINTPNLDFVNKLKSINKKSTGEFKQPFNEILIHEIALVNGKVNIDTDRKVHSENIQVKLRNYLIDSATRSLSDLTRDIKDLSFSSSKNRFELPDSIHELSINQIKLTSFDSTASFLDLKMNPIAERRTYSNYKRRGVKLINYATVKQVYVGGLDYGELIKNGQLLADSLLILAPSANITEYPYIKKLPKKENKVSFLIGSTFISNGKVNYNKRQNQQNNRSFAQGINLDILNIHSGSDKAVDYDDLKLIINNGFSNIRAIQHKLEFTNLESKNLTDIDIAKIILVPDSGLVNKSKFNIAARGLRIRGFKQVQKPSTLDLEISEFTLSTLNIDAKVVKSNTFGSNGPKLGKLKVAKFLLDKATFKLVDNEQKIELNDISTLIDSLVYNLNPPPLSSAIDFTDLLVKHGHFSYKSLKDPLQLSGKLGEFSETDSLIRFEDVSFTSSENINGSVKEIRLEGLDRQALLFNKGIRFKKLLVDRSVINVMPSTSKTKSTVFNADSIKAEILKKVAFVKFDTLESKGVHLTLLSKSRTTKIENISVLVGGYYLDSASNSEALYTPDALTLHFAKLTTNGINDTLRIDGLSLDLINSELFTGAINFSSVKNNASISASIPGLMANGFSTEQLLKHDYSVDTIRLSQARVNLETVDSIKQNVDLEWLNKDLSSGIKSLFKKSNSILLDTLKKAALAIRNLGLARLDTGNKADSKEYFAILDPSDEDKKPTIITPEDSVIILSPPGKAFPTHGRINHISLSNSVFNWTKNGRHHSYLDSVSFSFFINGIVLDTLNEFNVYNHIDEVNVKIMDYKFHLPDNLNLLTFEKMEISTKDEFIKINNLSLTPKVGKYDYANKVGHQIGWHRLQNLDLTVERLNLFLLLSNKIVHAEKITASNGQLKIFKDKELPIPVNQRRPMLQDAIKSIGLPILIDSIIVKNVSIDFASRLSSTMPEGSINFQELDAAMYNITNIDSSIFINPNLSVIASTKIMNKALLTTEFSFDMANENNSYTFNAHLGTMAANEFNSILSALAFVSVESGEIKDLSMTAKGDNFYTTGNMAFIYSDLKVSTINKKNLKTTGMGKVIKSFFANAFVVKKNNPTFKVFPRDGAMYYERDPQKIIIDYVTKTALSGVISSIGAKNARKDIKKLQKESKKQKDAERKALKRSGKGSIGGTEP